jgi:hypothetical protein
MPRVHRVASLLDRWWLGIHQGAIRPSHLDYYLVPVAKWEKQNKNNALNKIWPRHF